MVLNLFAVKAGQIQTYTLLEGRTKEIEHKSIDTFWFIAERHLLHTLLKVLLKDCREPHSGFLGSACGSQNSGWEPQLYSTVNCTSATSHNCDATITFFLIAQQWTTSDATITINISFFALWNCKKCDINKACVLRWQWLTVHFKTENLYHCLAPHTH